MNSGSILLIWGNRDVPSDEIPSSVFRMEDGFLRSFLGNAGFSKIHSIVLDSQGLHYDPSRPSDLETLLGKFEVSSSQLERAKKIRQEICRRKISKYSFQAHCDLSRLNSLKRKVILIPGQIEEGWSVQLGGTGKSMRDLVVMVRECNPSSTILYKVPPDLVGFPSRVEEIKWQFGKFVDHLVLHSSIDSCLSIADEVHTLTSLAGYEGLLREKKVFTYGSPFYAGWGLTTDANVHPRRKKRISLDEMVFISLVQFPKYRCPIRKKECEIETFIESMAQIRRRYQRSPLLHFLLKVNSIIFSKGIGLSGVQ